MGNCDADIDREVNRVIDQILREDRLESIGSNPCQDSCETRCEEAGDPPAKNCAVETSSRFSIRILEALRAVQRAKSGGYRSSSSTMKEVVQYIRRHYNYDGDLCSQVETTLNQVTRQGFVLRMGENRYWLVGPFACSVLNPPSPRRERGCDKDNRRNLSAGGRSPRCRSRSRGRQCTPIANSTCTDRGRLSEGEGDHLQRTAFHNQSRSNPFVRAPDRPPHNQTHDLSILQNVQAPVPMPPVQGPFGNGEGTRDRWDDVVDLPPIRRPGGNGGRARVIRDHSIAEVEHEMDPPRAEEQGCGAGCDREANDQSSDEVVGEVDPLDPDGGLARPGPCAGVVRRHSSEENMYREEPSMEVNRERCRRRRRPCRRRRRNCSTRRSRDRVSRSAAGRCRRNDSSCGSEADVSDESTEDERHAAKPWVRRCQKMFNRRDRRYSTCA